MMQLANSPFILNVKSPGSQLSSRNNSPVDFVEIKATQLKHRHRRIQSNNQSELPSILNQATIMGDKSSINSVVVNLKKTDLNNPILLTPQKSMNKSQSSAKIQVTPVLAHKSNGFDFLSETKKSLQNLGRNFFVKTPAGSRNSSAEKQQQQNDSAVSNKTLKRAPSMKEKEFVQTLKAAITPIKQNQKPDLHLDLDKILNDTKHVLCKDTKNTFNRAIQPHQGLPEIEIDLTKPLPVTFNRGIKSSKIDLTCTQAKKVSVSPNVKNSEDEQENMADLWRKVREQDYLMDEDEFFKRFLETDKLEFNFEKQMTQRRAGMFNPVATPEPSSKKYNVNTHAKMTIAVDTNNYHTNAGFLSTANSSTKGSSKSSNSGSSRTNEMSKESLKNLSKVKCIQEEPERLSFSSGSKSPCPSNKKISQKPKLNLKIGFEEDINSIIKSSNKSQSKNERPAKFFS